MATIVKNKRVQWVFFDIGDVVANEDKLRFNIYKILESSLREHTIDLTFQDIIACREDLILGHADESPHYTIAKMYLDKKAYDQWHDSIRTYIHKHLTRDLILVPGMDKVLKKLSKTYSLGIIADQPHEIMQFLKKNGIDHCFKIFAISGLLNMNKPRKKIFEWAVNHAGCSFGQAVMIGDRIDRDIFPAKQLDMMTIQARWNTYRKGFIPKNKKQELYLASLDRIKNWQIEPNSRSETADVIVEKVSDIPAVIQKLGPA